MQSQEFRYQPSRTSFINNITPTFWTASQLVGDSEEQHVRGEDDESECDTVVTASGEDGKVNIGEDSPSGDNKCKDVMAETNDGSEVLPNTDTVITVPLPSILKRKYPRSIPV